MTSSKDSNNRPTDDSRTEGLHDSLLCFTDFIYAIVFAGSVEKAFSEIIDNDSIDALTAILRLAPISALFYFITWDWILGRILTLRNPYRSYSRFFMELAIAGCSYATVIAAIKGDLRWYVYFSCVLFFGGVWARRTEKQVKYEYDRRELCITQSLQFSASALLSGIYIWLVISGAKPSAFVFATTPLGIWFFIFSYEFFVPRYQGISAGAGVPFLRRRYVRKIKREYFP